MLGPSQNNFFGKINAAITEQTKYFGYERFSWNDLARPLLGCPINKYRPLAVRVGRGQVDAVLEASKVT